MRPFWDEKLNLLSSDEPARERAVIANEIERHLESVERQRDEYFSEIQRARGIIEKLTLYRENLVCFIATTTSDQRDRIYELSDQADDFDRSVRELLRDFRRLSVLAAAPLDGGRGKEN